MDVLSAANELERAGHRIVHMEVGQPSAPAPEPVLEAARAALADGNIGYTEAKGRPALREKISDYYYRAHGLEVSPERIIVTTGSSAAFNLAFLGCFDVGDRIVMPAPGYPAYRNILQALGLNGVEIETGASTRWALTPDMIEDASREKTVKGVLVASPANPSGTMLEPHALKALCEHSDAQGHWFISDEIYHGLVYGGTAETALRFSDRAIIINSFSKYYCMTGWRIGWMVVPENMVRPIERLAQSFYISAPDLSQRAAIAAFDAPQALEGVKQGYAENRELLLSRLPQIGFQEILPVDGAFYAYASVRNMTNDSMEFAGRMLREAGVAATPGLDFDRARGAGYIRFSFAGALDDMIEAMDRLQRWRDDGGFK
ncbi:MAG: pyridoxal phosphate-dependent aminotransferase [Stappiaceae bacterium]